MKCLVLEHVGALSYTRGCRVGVNTFCIFIFLKKFGRFQLVQRQCGVGCVAPCCCMPFYIGDGNSRSTQSLYLCDMRYSGSLVVYLCIFVLAVRMNRKKSSRFVCIQLELYNCAHTDIQLYVIY